MHRTQIYLPTSQLKLLQKAAQTEGTSVSDVLRSLIQEYFVKAKPTTPDESLVDAAKRIAALGKGGPADLASQVDKYLYDGN